MKMIDVKPPEEETLKINFTEEQKQAFEEIIKEQNNLLIISEKPNPDMYLDKFQDVADRLRTLIEMRFDSEAVTVSMDFLKEIDWLLSVGHRAYMNKPDKNLHEISKTLKDILKEMRKRK
jgi:hypothetical protein